VHELFVHTSYSFQCSLVQTKMATVRGTVIYMIFIFKFKNWFA